MNVSDEGGGNSSSGMVDTCICFIVDSIFEITPVHTNIGLMITDCIAQSSRHSSTEEIQKQ